MLCTRPIVDSLHHPARPIFFYIVTSDNRSKLGGASIQKQFALAGRFKRFVFYIQPAIDTETLGHRKPSTPHLPDRAFTQPLSICPALARHLWRFDTLNLLFPSPKARLALNYLPIVWIPLGARHRKMSFLEWYTLVRAKDWSRKLRSGWISTR